MSNVVIDSEYAIKVVCKYVSVYLDGTNGFDGDEYCIGLCSKDVLVSW